MYASPVHLHLCNSNFFHSLTRKEMSKLFNGYAFYALNQATYLIINSITSFVTIVVYILMGNGIDSSKVFTVYSLLNSLQISISIGVPEAIRAVTDCKVSFARIEVSLCTFVG